MPAYNEAASIDDVTRRAVGTGLKVIVVDDGSSDGTGSIAARYGVTLLTNATNSGKAASLSRGIEHALAHGATQVITLDGDGQHRPEDAHRLIAAAAAYPDFIVIGSRRAHRGAFPAARYVANRVADFWISWAAGRPIEDTQSGFRLYPARVLREVGASSSRWNGFVFESEILISAAWRGHGTVSIDIEALYGGVVKRPSHFRPFVDITKIVLMVAGKLLSRGMHPAGLWRLIVGNR